MFQTYTESADPTKGRERAAALRAELKARGLSGFIVPRADEHQGEYVPPSAERLAWLTGFSGSAGMAIVLPDAAAIFVDGRYTLQVRNQVDTEVFTPVSSIETRPSEWLKAHVRDAAKIGFDPWLMTRDEVQAFEAALGASGAELVALDSNPLDAIWPDRPAAPLAQVKEHPDDLAGKPAPEKLTDVSTAIIAKGADAAILTDPASIAWLFNIRGADVPHTPLPLSFAIVNADGRPELFIDGRKLSNAVRDHLEGNADIREPAAFFRRLQDLGTAGRRVLFDTAGSAEAIARSVEAAGGTIVEGRDPVALPKARKSAAELAGSRAAHGRDGVAMVRFLAWFEAQPAGSLTEIDAAKALEEFRRQVGEEATVPLEEISFTSISSTGPNGAINHYRVTEASNRRIEAGDLYLIDSGAQYRDGTTDITRTLPVGDIAGPRLDLYRDRFTRVLKGHIALAMARFPKGTNGVQLDTLARSALWSAGLDFDHGTGHGVGSYLSVHEGPQRISKTGVTPLEPGMILSNEPGYYVGGDFGIRIENLIVVREPEMVPGGDRPMLSFETITLAPIDRRLIEPRLLSAAEIAWLDTYHARVLGAVGGWPNLSDSDRTWLAAACRPIVG